MAVSDHVFISYRREDTRSDAGRLYDSLAVSLGADRIFKDVDNIPLGHDFRDVITQAIGESAVMLVVIGPDYVPVDPSGKSRLDNPHDPVRIEIEHAFAAGLGVIPVLVDGATMPRPDRLPETLKGLAYKNASSLDHDTWNRDLLPLVEGSHTLRS